MPEFRIQKSGWSTACSILFAILLTIIALVSFFSSVSASLEAKSAIHQILAAIYFLTCTVSIAGLGVMASK